MPTRSKFYDEANANIPKIAERRAATPAQKLAPPTITREKLQEMIDTLRSEVDAFNDQYSKRNELDSQITGRKGQLAVEIRKLEGQLQAAKAELQGLEDLGDSPTRSQWIKNIGYAETRVSSIAAGVVNYIQELMAVDFGGEGTTYKELPESKRDEIFWRVRKVGLIAYTAGTFARLHRLPDPPDAAVNAALTRIDQALTRIEEVIAE